MATVTIPKILANFETSLSSKITSAASSLTMDRSTDMDGTTLSGTYSLTLDEGTSLEEHMVVTLAGSAGTIVRRGLSRADAWTEVSGNKKEHDRGASIKVTNVSQINLQRLLNGDDSFNSVAWTGVASITGLSTPTSGETTKAANVAYVNAVSVAGANDASTSAKGIVEIATQAENNAGTATGGTGALLVATPAVSAVSVQNSVWTYAADAQANDSYAITLSPAPTAYASGQSFVFKANTANTGAATLNVNSLGAKDVKKYCNGAISALETNDIVAGMVVHVTYDGTQFIMHSDKATALDSAVAYETQQFFSSTDITAAEAETLTSGSTSDASALHQHKMSSVVGTRDLSTATGSATYAHGLGKTPRWVRITGKWTNSAANRAASSYGTYDGSNTRCVSTVDISGGTFTSESSTTFVVKLGLTAAYQTATISVDATNVTLSWTKTGSPDGNGYLLIETEA